MMCPGWTPIMEMCHLQQEGLGTQMSHCPIGNGGRRGHHSRETLVSVMHGHWHGSGVQEPGGCSQKGAKCHGQPLNSSKHKLIIGSLIAPPDRQFNINSNILQNLSYLLKSIL